MSDSVVSSKARLVLGTGLPMGVYAILPQGRSLCPNEVIREVQKQKNHYFNVLSALSDSNNYFIFYCSLWYNQVL